MDKFTVDFEGFSDFEQQLVELANIHRADLVVRNTLVKSAKVAMECVYHDAVAYAPYDINRPKPVHHNDLLDEKPHLRDTMRLDARIPNERDKLSEYVNDTDIAIAVVSVKKSAVSLSQEFGNARTAPQPFLIPSLRKNVQNVLTALKSELSYVIPAYAKKLQKKRTK